jgi:hypothetical protein
MEDLGLYERATRLYEIDSKEVVHGDTGWINLDQHTVQL